MTCKCGDSAAAARPFSGHSPEWCPEPRIYRIIRFHFNGRPRTIRNNVTLTEAQAHCGDPKTNSSTDTKSRIRGRWFDGYDYMPGCRPKS